MPILGRRLLEQFASVPEIVLGDEDLGPPADADDLG
jgi:hypothetical protein